MCYRARLLFGRRLLNIRRRGGKTDLLDRRWRRRGGSVTSPSLRPLPFTPSQSSWYYKNRFGNVGQQRLYVCVCVCVCCGLVAAARQKTVCVYITEYNRNVIPLAGISPSRIVGTPYLLSGTTTYCRRRRRHHHHHTNRHTVVRSTPLLSPLARLLYKCVCVFICVYYIYIYTTRTYTLTYIYIHIYILFAATPAAVAPVMSRSLAYTHRFVVKPTVLTIDRFPPLVV